MASDSIASLCVAQKVTEERSTRNSKLNNNARMAGTTKAPTTFHMTSATRRVEYCHNPRKVGPCMPTSGEIGMHGPTFLGSTIRCKIRMSIVSTSSRCAWNTEGHTIAKGFLAAWLSLTQPTKRMQKWSVICCATIWQTTLLLYLRPTGTGVLSQFFVPHKQT